MALNAYLKLKGSKTGNVDGSVVQKGREKQIAVYSSSHQILSPYNPIDALPNGKLEHKPFVITKEVDKSTPKLYQLLTTNEVCSQCEILFWKASNAGNATGTETQFYTVKLTNARIVDIQFRMLFNKDPQLMRYEHLEDITFVYEKIEWTFTDGGIMCQDDWKA